MCDIRFVRTAKEKDRRSCLCTKNVEIQIVLKDCMRCRKSVIKKNGLTDATVPSTITEAVNLTLCEKKEESKYHKMNCLNWNCHQCRVHKFTLLPEELSDATDEPVTWKHDAYIVKWSRKEEGIFNY